MLLSDWSLVLLFCCSCLLLADKGFSFISVPTNSHYLLFGQGFRVDMENTRCIPRNFVQKLAFTVSGQEPGVAEISQLCARHH